MVDEAIQRMRSTAGFDGANGTMWRAYVDNLVQYDKQYLQSEGQNEEGYDVRLIGKVQHKIWNNIIESEAMYDNMEQRNERERQRDGERNDGRSGDCDN